MTYLEDTESYAEYLRHCAYVRAMQDVPHYACPTCGVYAAGDEIDNATCAHCGGSF